MLLIHGHFYIVIFGADFLAYSTRDVSTYLWTALIKVIFFCCAILSIGFFRKVKSLILKGRRSFFWKKKLLFSTMRKVDLISFFSLPNANQLFISVISIVDQKIKKVQAKKTHEIKYINQFHEIFFWPNSIFCNFKNGQKSFFEQGKSLKLPKMQFYEKSFLFIWVHEVFF